MIVFGSSELKQMYHKVTITIKGLMHETNNIISAWIRNKHNGLFFSVSGGMLAGSLQTEFMAQGISRTDPSPKTSVLLEKT